MMQLGSRQARYFGRAKTLLQWLIAGTVANLTLAAGQEKGRKAANHLDAPLHTLLSHIAQAIRRLFTRSPASTSKPTLATLNA